MTREQLNNIWHEFNLAKSVWQDADRAYSYAVSAYHCGDLSEPDYMEAHRLWIEADDKFDSMYAQMQTLPERASDDADLEIC